jgi:3',5'-cyclic AMP phosphodiesterase CpdA
MDRKIDRREFVRLAGFGGLVFASGLGATACASGPGARPGAQEQDFYFVQLSDTHWGFEGAPNPDSHGTLPKAIEAVNALAQPPDFVVFTGDLTHLTPDGKLRRARMSEFRELVAKLKVRDVRFLPGEHDASLDRGEAYQELFGPTHYTFDHKGVHFIALDNVSDPNGAIGEAQLAWLATDLARLSKDTPIVVLTHRPLFDLAPQWGWATADSARALELLAPYSGVTVFYGHIHQEHHQMTGSIAQHAAKSLIFPLPPPGSPDKKPLAWDASQPYRGLGWREVETGRGKASAQISEFAVRSA